MSEIQNANQEQNIIKTRSVKSGTKMAKLIEMIERPEGGSLKQIEEELKWQKHTVRGAISRLKKLYGINIINDKSTSNDRVYKTTKND